jgi:hypothetical protein
MYDPKMKNYNGKDIILILAEYGIDILKHLKKSKFIVNKGEKHKVYAVPMRSIRKIEDELFKIRKDIKHDESKPSI